MQLYKNGMKLMRDTASLTNAMIENFGSNEELKPGSTFCQLHWTDRTLWVITRVISATEFFAARAETTMKHWTEGTEYPVYDEKGNIKVTPNSECYFRFSYKNWKRFGCGFLEAFFGEALDKFFKDTGNMGKDIQRAVIKFCRTKRPERVHLSFGCDTGYRDPSF